jgi:drug/metabolite transporter (DMT)-like permease
MNTVWLSPCVTYNASMSTQNTPNTAPNSAPNTAPNTTIPLVATSVLSTHLGLLGMAVLWGASWPAGKLLALAASPMHAAAWRFSVACIALLLWLAIANKGLPRLSMRQTLGMILGGAVGVFGYAYFFMYGLQSVPAGRASLVVTLNPVMTTLGAAIIFGERMNRKIAIGMVMAFLGGLIVLTHGAPWKLFAGEMGHGEWLLLGCAVAWSAYSLLGKKLLQGVPALTATTYTACAGLVLLWAAALIFEPAQSPWGLGLETHGAIAFLGLGATVLAYVWYFKGIAALGAGTAASYISLVPVFGVLSSVLYLHESVDASLLIGGALAVAGVVWMNKARTP